MTLNSFGQDIAPVMSPGDFYATCRHGGYAVIVDELTDDERERAVFDHVVTDRKRFGDDKPRVLVLCGRTGIFDSRVDPGARSAFVRHRVERHGEKLDAGDRYLLRKD